MRDEIRDADSLATAIPHSVEGEPLRDPAFARLWTAQVVSSLGTEITLLAVPLLAVTVLAAGAGEVALLSTAATLPILIVGLPAGGLADRRDRRGLMVASDLVRGAVLFLVPVAVMLGVASVAVLWLVVFAVGCATVLFDVALQAAFPSIVARERLAAGNARLQLGVQSAGLVGPAVAGLAIGAIGAASAVVIDAVSYLASAVLILGIRSSLGGSKAASPETATGHAAATDGGIRAGLRFVIRQPILRTTIAAVFLFGLGARAVEALLIVALVRIGGLGAAAIGVVFSAAAIGFVVGAIVAERVIERYGLGRSLVGALGLAVFGAVVIAAAPAGAYGPVVAVGLALHGLAAMVFVIGNTSIRQAVTPDALLGRVSAAARVVGATSFPVGALLGAILATAIGLREAIVVAAAITCLSLLPLLASPVPGIRRLAEVTAASDRSIGGPTP